MEKGLLLLLFLALDNVGLCVLKVLPCSVEWKGLYHRERSEVRHKPQIARLDNPEVHVIPTLDLVSIASRSFQ